jgi:hypothetical protein
MKNIVNNNIKLNVGRACKNNADKVESCPNACMLRSAENREVVTVEKAIIVRFAGDQMTHGGTSAVSVYNADQKAIIEKFGEKERLDGVLAFEIERVKEPNAASYTIVIPIKYNNENEMVSLDKIGYKLQHIRTSFENETEKQMYFLIRYLHSRYSNPYESISSDKNSADNLQLIINKK